jgi:hypothetical protein
MLRMLFSTDNEPSKNNSRTKQNEMRQRTLIDRELDLPSAPLKGKNWFTRQLTKAKSEKPEKQSEWVIKKL